MAIPWEGLHLHGWGFMSVTSVKTMREAVIDLRDLLAMEAHGRQGIVEVRVVDSVILWQLHGLLGPLLQILNLCVCVGTVCTASTAFSTDLLTCYC